MKFGWLSSVAAISLCIVATGACKKPQGSATLGISDGADSNQAVGFLPMHNEVEADTSKWIDNNPGKQYANDLIKTKLFAYVECISTTDVKANVWMLLAETNAAADNIVLGSDRKIYVKSSEGRQMLPCTVFDGRLMSYPVALAIMISARDGGHVDRDAYDVMQFFFLALKGYEVPGRAVSPLMLAFSHMAQEHGGGSAMTATQVVEMMKNLDRDYNPCSTQGMSAKYQGEASKWRNANFRCFNLTSGQSAKGFSPAMSADKFAKLKQTTLVRIAAYHKQLTDQVNVSPAGLKVLWDVLTAGNSWARFKPGTPQAELALLLKGESSANSFDMFASDIYGPKAGGSLGLTDDSPNGLALSDNTPRTVGDVRKLVNNKNSFKGLSDNALLTGAQLQAYNKYAAQRQAAATLAKTAAPLPKNPGQTNVLPSPTGDITKIGTDSSGKATQALSADLQNKVTTDLKQATPDTIKTMSPGDIGVLRAEAKLAGDTATVAKIDASTPAGVTVPKVEVMGQGGVGANQYLAFQQPATGAAAGAAAPAERYSYRGGVNQDWAATKGSANPFDGATNSAATTTKSAEKVDGPQPSTPAAKEGSASAPAQTGPANVTMAQPAGTTAYRYEQGTAVVGNRDDTSASVVNAAGKDGKANAIPVASGDIQGGRFEFIGADKQVKAAGAAFPTGFTNAADGSVAQDAKLAPPATAVLAIKSNTTGASAGTWSVETTGKAGDDNRAAVMNAANSSLAQLSSDQAKLCTEIKGLNEQLAAAKKETSDPEFEKAGKLTSQIDTAQGQLDTIQKEAAAIPKIAAESGVELTPAQTTELATKSTAIVDNTSKAKAGACGAGLALTCGEEGAEAPTEGATPPATDPNADPFGANSATPPATENATPPQTQETPQQTQETPPEQPAAQDQGPQE